MSRGTKDIVNDLRHLSCRPATRAVGCFAWGLPSSLYGMFLDHRLHLGSNRWGLGEFGFGFGNPRFFCGCGSCALALSCTEPSSDPKRPISSTVSRYCSSCEMWQRSGIEIQNNRSHEDFNSMPPRPCNCWLSFRRQCDREIHKRRQLGGVPSMYACMPAYICTGASMHTNHEIQIYQ